MYANSDYNYQHLRPGNLLAWEAIKHYFSYGYKIFDFGKTECGNEGLRMYKSGFSPVEIPLFHFLFDIRKNSFKLKKPLNLKLHGLFFMYAPVSRLKFVGEKLNKFVAD